MKLKHLLALIWVLAYHTEWGRARFVNFEYYETKESMFKRAEQLGRDNDCPEYTLSVDTHSLVTTKYAFFPPYCVPDAKRHLIETDITDSMSMCIWAKKQCPDVTFKQCAEWISDYCPD